MALNDIRSRFSQALYGTETFSYSENLIPLLPQRPQTSVSDQERSSMDLPMRDDEDSRLNINASHSEYESLVSEDVTGEELGLLSQREDSMIAPDAPTTEEKLRLRRVSDKIPISAFVIVFVEFAERFSFYGTIGPFVNFVQQPLPPGSVAGNVVPKGADGTAGALGKGQQTSTAIMNLFIFWAYSTPIFGAIVADVKLGRFWTICIFAFICFIGHIALIVVALPSVIAQVNAALAGFIFSVIILGLGTGGIKANVSALVADQCNSENLRVKRLRNGERVIVDPSLTLQRVFMYFYMCINFGAFASLITVYAEKDVGYWLAFLVPTLVFTLVPAVLLIGKNYYVKVPPRGSVVMEACKMVNMACRGRWSLNPFRLYRNFNAPDLWNVVKPSFYESLSSDDGVKKPSWITWDESFVLEVTTALRACKILTFYPIYWFANLQCYSNLISQAAVMKTNGTPNDLINNLGALFLIVLIPLFDRIIYPMLRRWRFTLTPIKRITTGFFIASIAMAHASIIQLLIYRNSPCGKFASTCTIDGKVVKANVNVWHQAPTYLLMSLSELLTAVSGLEYCYSKGPKSMKSIILSISMLAGSLCSILNLAMVPFAKDPYLVWNYAGTGVVTFIAANIFWITFKQLDKDDEAATAHETNTHGSQDEL